MDSDATREIDTLERKVKDLEREAKKLKQIQRGAKELASACKKLIEHEPPLPTTVAQAEWDRHVRRAKSAMRDIRWERGRRASLTSGWRHLPPARCLCPCSTTWRCADLAGQDHPAKQGSLGVSRTLLPPGHRCQHLFQLAQIDRLDEVAIEPRLP
jgi:hypothetical protein